MRLTTPSASSSVSSAVPPGGDTYRLIRFHGRDQARLRLSARVAIATSARRASLTDFESGKASANFGSISTTLTPRRYLSTYLPRTPPEKSYSALISRGRVLEGVFLELRFLFLVAERAPIRPIRSPLIV